MQAAPPADESFLAALSARTEVRRQERYADRVHASLSQAILRGDVAPGARLPSEEALAAHFGVSRPVVRQALQKLRAQALVASLRGSGSYVQAPPVARARGGVPSGVDIRHILHGVELRLVVEPEAAALAALRRSPADLERLQACVDGFARATAAGESTHAHDFGFHEGIARATANPRLLQVLQALEYDVDHAVKVWRHLGRLKPAMRMLDAVDEHRAILRCIREQDAEGARRAMRSHLEKARVRMMDPGP